VAWAIDGLAWTAGQHYTGGKQAQLEINLVNKLDLASDTPIDLKIGVATAAVGSGWGSSGSAMTRDKASTIVPSSLVPEWLNEFLDLSISFFEPEGPQFGCIKPDIVAADRLEPYSGSQGC
jgi:hypothetical protein